MEPLKINPNAKEILPLCDCGTQKIRYYKASQSKKAMEKFGNNDASKIYKCPICDSSLAKSYKASGFTYKQRKCIRCAGLFMSLNDWRTCPICVQSLDFKSPEWVEVM